MVLRFVEADLSVHDCKETHAPEARTHLVCHLSELVNDGSYQIKTRQRIKTAVSPSPPPQSLFSLCLSVSFNSPACLASITPPVYSNSLIPEGETELMKWHQKFIFAQINGYPWMKMSSVQSSSRLGLFLT